MASTACLTCRPPSQSSSTIISSSTSPPRFPESFVHNPQSRTCPSRAKPRSTSLHAGSLCSFSRNCQRVHCSPRSMAPDEEKMTRRSPLDFPIEWERPRPGRRPDIFPQFSPMKTPLPQPPPTDPPEEDEEEEEKKEEEEKPEEEPDKPPKET
ncbi:hypothetical protein GOP47_0025222 [Adiantum capillus-veneris]|uniref:Uncharacterized protein n=1 Tax=Adiantum capillus-veneris TaxID=13818 RepID=A0A9D4Z507_ADICA|nr:hypothetical protein GOP47_0025222 [Adiantum capillus-veneris]